MIGRNVENLANIDFFLSNTYIMKIQFYHEIKYDIMSQKTTFMRFLILRQP